MFRRWLIAVALVMSLSAPVGAAELDATRAFGYLKQICDLGPRISGSEGMTRQQAMITEHFTKLGAKVFEQEFDVRHPETGVPVRLKNLIVSWQPEAAQRVILCCHYDTRPYPDEEPLPQNRLQPFIGANDGASGVALFMEMGHHMASIQPKLGVDFVFFDGEEFIFQKVRDKFFHGSEHFAQQYRDKPPTHRYSAGVLVDMVGDKNLRIDMERLSLRYAPEVTQSVFQVAQDLKVKEFVRRRGNMEINDDHVALNQIAKIPTVDLIDFDYPYWHTRNDLPAACSGESLAKVGKVLLAWLERWPAK
jgi:glutaminyl-peptide cyclotransferase